MTAADFATRRTFMVDTQVRPSDVTKFPIIAAMLAVPRERFVPAARREAAYVGEPLDIGGGRLMLDARCLAKMLDALDVQPTDSVLHIGCGYGYGTAVLARMAEFVAAVEDDETRAAQAQAVLSDTGADNAAVFAGPLAAGGPKCAPYDAILIEGGIEVLPDAVADQLKDGGRVAVIRMDGALGEARLGVKSDGRISWRGVFNAAVPVLPGFARPAAFML